MPFPTQLAPMDDNWLIAKRQQAARANASMMDIIAELRAAGLLKRMWKQAEQTEIQKDHDEEREGGWAV